MTAGTENTFYFISTKETEGASRKLGWGCKPPKPALGCTFSSKATPSKSSITSSNSTTNQGPSVQVLDPGVFLIQATIPWDLRNGSRLHCYRLWGEPAIPDDAWGHSHSPARLLVRGSNMVHSHVSWILQESQSWHLCLLPECVVSGQFCTLNQWTWKCSLSLRPSPHPGLLGSFIGWI